MLSTCPRCGCPNIAGSSVCMECTEPLVDSIQRSGSKRETLPTDGRVIPDYPSVVRISHLGKLGPNTIALYANAIEDPIFVEVHDEITLGRRIANSAIQP